MNIQKVCDNCKKKLHSVISNGDINLTALQFLLLSVVRHSLEYGSEIWGCNKLESIILGGAKKILGCSSKTCNEAVWG